MTSAFESYQIFQSLKFHFTREDFDALKYNYSTRANFETFEKDNKHKFVFLKWAKKFPVRDKLIQFYVANIISNPFKVWIGDCEMSRYNSWKGRIDGLSYHFEQDIKKLYKQNKDLTHWVVPEKDNIPNIVTEYKGGRVSLETLTIINLLTPFLNVTSAPDFIWKEEKLLLKKYPAFLPISDKKHLAKIVTSVFLDK